MHSLRIMFGVLVTMLVAQSAVANGDPVLRYSSINRVANPEPLDVSEIRIDKELLKITREGSYNCFEVTYYLNNTSNIDFPELHYGFPIDYLVVDEREIYTVTDDWLTESSYETGWNERLIKDVSFRLDDRELSFSVSKEPVRAPGFELDCDEDSTMCDSIPVDGVNRRWFYTTLSIAPKSKAVLKVNYKVYAAGHSRKGLNARTPYTRMRDEHETGYYDSTFFNRYLTDNFRIVYDFSPAKHFGQNNSFSLDVLIDLSGLDEPLVRNYSSGYNRYTYSASKVYYNCWGSADSFEPIDLWVIYKFDSSRENIEQIVEKFSYPAEDFNVEYSADRITIDFPTPRFISEVVCDIDTTEVHKFDADIIYQSGRREHSVYSSIQPDPRYSLPQPISPSLVIITDEGDRYWWVIKDLEEKDKEKYGDYDQIYFAEVNDLTGDDFKVRRITFTFPSGMSPKSSPAMQNIRPLDSRFVKP